MVAHQISTLGAIQQIIIDVGNHIRAGGKQVRFNKAIKRWPSRRPGGDVIVIPVIGCAIGIERTHSNHIGVITRHGDGLRIRATIARRRDDYKTMRPGRFYRAVDRIDKVGGLCRPD